MRSHPLSALSASRALPRDLHAVMRRYSTTVIRVKGTFTFYIQTLLNDAAFPEALPYSFSPGRTRKADIPHR
jgi:hypothetical protein